MKEAKIQLPELTADQVDAILKIGNPDAVSAAIQSDVLDELLQLGLMYKRADGPLEFTDLGDLAYRTLAPKHGYPKRWGD